MYPHVVRRSLVIALAAAGMPALAQAPAQWNASPANLIGSLMSDSVFNQAAGPIRATARGGGTTTFRPGRRLVVEQYAGPRREQTARTLADCDRVFADAMARTGAAGALNDVAVATAFYISIAHYIYWRDQPGAPPEAQGLHILTLSERLRGGYIARGTFVGKSDEEKQAAHDTMLMAACGPLLRFVQTRKTASERTRLAMREEALVMLNKVGLSPQSVRFQPGGAVLAGRN
jgi:hypothetical protein